MFNTAAANLLGTLVSFILWGMYSCLFVATIWIAKANKAKLNLVLGAVVVLYLCSFCVVVLDFIFMYRGFITFERNSDTYFNGHYDHGIDVINDLMITVASLTADATLTWRLYVIWSRDVRMIILPCIALAAGVIGGATIFFFDVRQAIRGGTSQPQIYHVWTQALFVLELVMTWLLTLIITGKLWWIGRRTSGSRGGGFKYKRVVLALVEGGAMYSLVSMWLIVAYACDATNLFNFGADILQIVIGVVPTLILLVLSLGHLQAADVRPEPHEPVLAKPSPDAARQMVVRQSAPLVNAKTRALRRDSLSIDLSDLNTYPESSTSKLESTRGPITDLEAQKLSSESTSVIEG